MLTLKVSEPAGQLMLVISILEAGVGGPRVQGYP